MNARYFVALLAAFVLASCSSSVDSPDLVVAGSMAPIVTGIRVTYETGQFVGNWGNPTDGPEAAGKLSVNSGGGIPVGGGSGTSPGLLVLAPNPCAGDCPIRFNLERSASVRLWVVPARLAGMSGPDMESVVGARVVAPRLTVVKTLDSGSMREAGQHTDEWDGTDDAGNRLPSGFYRIFLSIDNVLYWRDLLLFNTRDELPGSIQSIID
jgi:hypothetical protein